MSRRTSHEEDMALIERAKLVTKADCLAALVRALAREAALLMSESQVRWALANHELSSAELKIAEKHCDWSAFKHAFNAVMSARAQAASVWSKGGTCDHHPV